MSHVLSIFFLTLFFLVVFLFQIGPNVPGNAGLGVPVDAGSLSGMGEGCDGHGVLDSVGLQALPMLLVGAGLGLLQVGESCGILIVGGYIEGWRVLAGAGFDDR